MPPHLQLLKGLVDRGEVEAARELERLRGTINLISTTLFPPSTENDNKSRIIHDVDENLSAALYDLDRLEAYAVCRNTIRHVLAQLRTVRKIVGAAAWNNK